MFEQNDADAGGNRVIVRLTKIDTGYIGYQIAHCSSVQGIGRAGKSVSCVVEGQNPSHPFGDRLNLGHE